MNCTGTGVEEEHGKEKMMESVNKRGRGRRSRKGGKKRRVGAK